MTVSTPSLSINGTITCLQTQSFELRLKHPGSKRRWAEPQEVKNFQKRTSRNTTRSVGAMRLWIEAESQ